MITKFKENNVSLHRCIEYWSEKFSGQLEEKLKDYKEISEEQLTKNSSQFAKGLFRSFFPKAALPIGVIYYD